MRKPPWSKMTKFGRFFRFLARGGGILAVLLLLLFAAAFFIDEPLRRLMERGMNKALDGYGATIGETDFHPLDLSVTVRDLVLRQEAHPDPPVAYFPEIEASIQWRELLTGSLVSDWRFERPQLYLNLQQLKAENEDEKPVEERGWQDALQQIYPVRINRLRIDDGSLTYIDADPEHPLKLTGVNLTAGNIRNIRSPEQTYPSSFHLEADIFGTGHGRIDGKADFLAKPHPGVAAEIRLQEVPLDRFGPVTSRANFHLSGGIFSGAGRIEYSPAVKDLRLADLTIDGLRLDYVHAAATAEAERARAEKAKKAAKEAKESEWQFLVKDLHLTRGAFAFVNRAQEPDYRVSLGRIDLRLRNLSNRFHAGAAEAHLEGEFMDSGDTLAIATFRPEEKGADFDLLVAIEGTRMTEMNPLLRAHAGLDVVTGSFSVYSEVRVRGTRIDGYVKPFFTDLDIYDPRQEKGESLIGKIKEGLAGALSQLLENPREQVATRFDLSGSVEDPEASSWQVVLQLIRNGFFNAILPGFDKRGNKQ